MTTTSFDSISSYPDPVLSPFAGNYSLGGIENCNSPLGVSRRFQAGYLCQRVISGGFFKLWKKRYFRLRDDGILCYKSQDEANFRSVVLFNDESKISWYSSRPYSFCIENSIVQDKCGNQLHHEEPVILQALDEVDRNQWAAAIRIKIDMKRTKKLNQHNEEDKIIISEIDYPSSMNNNLVRRAVNSMMKKNLALTRDTFHAKYSIGAQIGAGSFSIVRKAIDRETGALFAEKSITLTLAVREEVAILKTLDHPNVISLIDFYEYGNLCHVITDYMPDGDLCDKLMEVVKYPELEVRRIIGKCLKGIEYFHAKRIVHRDIKPENILIDRHHVKIADFGLAKQLNDCMEMLVSTCGTPEYAAPELLEEKPYGLSCDIFSLGVVTYIMLFGAFPFGVESAQALQQLESFTDGAKARKMTCLDAEQWKNVSADAKEVVLKMLEPNPTIRIGASKLLQHQWFKDVVPSDEEALYLEKQRKEEVLFEGFKMLLLEGIAVIKHGRKGSPHATKIYLDGNILKWYSKHRYLRPAVAVFDRAPAGNLENSEWNDFSSTSVTSQTQLIREGIALESILKVVKGKSTEVLQRQEIRAVEENLCFSLITSIRTLDLEMPSVQLRDSIVDGFSKLIEQSR